MRKQIAGGVHIVHGSKYSGAEVITWRYVQAERLIKNKGVRYLCLRVEKYFPKRVNSNSKQDCTYLFPIDLGPIGIPIAAKSIGKW